MQPGERRTVVEELVPMLIEVADNSKLEELLVDLDEQEVLWLLSQVDEDTIKSLKIPEPRKILVGGELARRLTRSTAAYAQRKCLNCLWDFLNENEGDSWAKASALVLATFHSRLTAQLEVLDTKLLRQACEYLKSRDSARSFAMDFFDSDLGISTLEQWPPTNSSSIFAELARHLDVKHDEKLDLLATAYEHDGSDEDVRSALRQLLSQRIMQQGSSGEDKHLEGLLLKVFLEGKEEIPTEVMQELSLRPESFEKLSAEQRMRLAEMLKKANRKAEGARVALAAAELFSAKSMEDESQDAIMYALSLDHTDANTSTVLFQLVRSIRGKCKELSSKLEKAQEALAKPPVWHLTWDLSGYDFAHFTEKRQQFSENFQLGASGVEAKLCLTPKASPDKAGVLLFVSEPVWVKCRCQSGSWERTLEHEFAKTEDGSLLGCGWPKSIPISFLTSGITFHLLSVRRPGSSLRLVAPSSMEPISRPPRPPLPLVGLTFLRPQQPQPHTVWCTCGVPELARSWGKWYYEVQMVNGISNPQIGWLTTEFQPGDRSIRGVGDDPYGWAFDGVRGCWWHDGRHPLKLDSWRLGDVLGFAIDLNEGTMQLCTEGGTVTMPAKAHGSLYPAVSTSGLFCMHLSRSAWRLQPPEGYQDWCRGDLSWAD
ncbi:RSPRY1 [Symbiodinium natans]|uniref:RSPRY1 protein n=1 Tax=Symbiodinium natans TaxID=878477 RepID=A0A812PRV7_9DINO|nr:RSPRY1 [Symbiodinium natans]